MLHYISVSFCSCFCQEFIPASQTFLHPFFISFFVLLRISDFLWYIFLCLNVPILTMWTLNESFAIGETSKHIWRPIVKEKLALLFLLNSHLNRRISELNLISECLLRRKTECICRWTMKWTPWSARLARFGCSCILMCSVNTVSESSWSWKSADLWLSLSFYMDVNSGPSTINISNNWRNFINAHPTTSLARLCLQPGSLGSCKDHSGY